MLLSLAKDNADNPFSDSLFIQISLLEQLNHILSAFFFLSFKKLISDISLYNSVQFSRSVVSDFVTPWTTAPQTPVSITKSQSPSKPTSNSWYFLLSVYKYHYLNYCFYLCWLCFVNQNIYF